MPPAPKEKSYAWYKSAKEAQARKRQYLANKRAHSKAIKDRKKAQIEEQKEILESKEIEYIHKGNRFVDLCPDKVKKKKFYIGFMNEKQNLA